MKFSIITVTYNAEATIERTMESVAQQTYPDIEHLVIDGASKDRTVEIVKRYGYEHLSNTASALPTPFGGRGAWLGGYISEPDKGLYDAMNKGIRLATGDFLCFLNAGDKLHSKETIEHIAAASTTPFGGKGAGVGNHAVLYGDTHIVDAQGNFLRNRRLTPPEHLTWRSFHDGMLVCHQAFYVNRTIAQPYDLSYRFSADFDWCIRCMKEGEHRGMTNLYIKEPLADYLAEGMTTANHKASLKERFRIMAKHYGLLPTIGQHIWFIFRAFIKK